jgi:hypothetical protein
MGVDDDLAGTTSMLLGDLEIGVELAVASPDQTASLLAGYEDDGAAVGESSMRSADTPTSMSSTWRSRLALVSRGWWSGGPPRSPPSRRGMREVDARAGDAGVEAEEEWWWWAERFHQGIGKWGGTGGGLMWGPRRMKP